MFCHHLLVKIMNVNKCISLVGIKAALEQIGNYYKLHGNKYVVEKDLIKQVLHDRDIDHLVRYR